MEIPRPRSPGAEAMSDLPLFSIPTRLPGPMETMPDDPWLVALAEELQRRREEEMVVGALKRVALRWLGLR